jgi:hypothetical protein
VKYVASVQIALPIFAFLIPSKDEISATEVAESSARVSLIFVLKIQIAAQVSAPKIDV